MTTADGRRMGYMERFKVWLVTDFLKDQLEDLMGDHEDRIEHLDYKSDVFEHELDDRFEELDGKIDDLERDVDEKVDELREELKDD